MTRLLQQFSSNIILPILNVVFILVGESAVALFQKFYAAAAVLATPGSLIFAVPATVTFLDFFH